MRPSPSSPPLPAQHRFAWNGPRLTWEAKRNKDETTATEIAFTCTKGNNLPRKPDPFGLRFVPGETATTIYPLSLVDAPATLTAGASITYRLRLLLAQGIETPEALAAKVDAEVSTVKRLLRRLREQGKACERALGSDTWKLT